MLHAFLADLSDAYEQLRKRQMGMDKSVDVYPTNIKRFSKIIDPEIC